MSRRYMTKAEYNAMIAGLRLLQQALDAGFISETRNPDIDDILCDGVTQEQVDELDIDQFIMDIQFDEVQMQVEGDDD